MILVKKPRLSWQVCVSEWDGIVSRIPHSWAGIKKGQFHPATKIQTALSNERNEKNIYSICELWLWVDSRFDWAQWNSWDPYKAFEKVLFFLSRASASLPPTPMATPWVELVYGNLSGKIPSPGAAKRSLGEMVVDEGICARAVFTCLGLQGCACGSVWESVYAWVGGRAKNHGELFPGFEY